MMKLTQYIAFVLLFAQFHGSYANQEELYCKEEFDMSAYWYEGMTWREFLKIRNNLEQPELIKYVDKIEQQKIAAEAGIAVPKTYIATREKTPITDILSKLPAYVAKPIHLSYSRGIIIVKDGKDIVTGQEITSEQVQEHMFKTIDLERREKDTWALHQVEPGFMIQEYIPNRQEVQIQTVWGKAILGIWRGGEQARLLTYYFGQYTRDGEILQGNLEAPEWWPKAIATAELIAKGTDALRVDFLVRENGELVLNEFGLCPENSWTTLKLMEDALNEGYRNYCAQKKNKRIEGDT